MALSLAFGREPGADQAYGATTLSMAYNNKPGPGGDADRDPPQLAFRVFRVIEGGREWIIEDGHCLLEGHAVLPEV